MGAFLLTLSLCVPSASTLIGQTPSAPGDDKAAVRAVVESYLHGLKFNDVDSLKKAFWPDAKLFFNKPDGTLGQLTQGDWYSQFASAAGQESKAALKIAALEVTNDAAAVKVTEDYPTARYTDYLSLLRIEGRWQIVNKIFTKQGVRK